MSIFYENPYSTCPISVAGFQSKIPGFPRYTMFGDSRHGVFNLRISNASLDDEAEFQCQVGPSGSSRAIRANASLTVICKLEQLFQISDFRFLSPHSFPPLRIISCDIQERRCKKFQSRFQRALLASNGSVKGCCAL